MQEFGQTGSPDTGRVHEHVVRAHLGGAMTGAMEIRRPDGAAAPSDTSAATASPGDALGPPPDGRTPDEGARWPRPSEPDRDTPPAAGGPTDRDTPPPDRPGMGGEAGDNPHNALQLFLERVAQPPPTVDEAAEAEQIRQTVSDVWRDGFESFEGPGFSQVGRVPESDAIVRKLAKEHLDDPTTVAEGLEVIAAYCGRLDAYIQTVGDRAVTSAEPPAASSASEGIDIGQLEVRNVAGQVTWSNRVPSDSDPADTTREGTFEPYVLAPGTVQFVNGSGTELHQVQTDGSGLVTQACRAHTLPADASDFLDTFRSELTSYAALLRDSEDPAANPAAVHAQVTASIIRIAALLHGETRHVGYVPDNVDMETLTGYLVRFTGTIEANYRAMTDDPEPAIPRNHTKFERMAAQGPPTAEQSDVAAALLPHLDPYNNLADIVWQLQDSDNAIEPDDALFSVIDTAFTASQELTAFAASIEGKCILTATTAQLAPKHEGRVGQYAYRVTNKGIIVRETANEDEGDYTRHDTADGIHFVNTRGTHRVSFSCTEDGLTLTDQTVHEFSNESLAALRETHAMLNDVHAALMEVIMGSDTLNADIEFIEAIDRLAASIYRRTAFINLRHIMRSIAGNETA